MDRVRVVRLGTMVSACGKTQVHNPFLSEKATDSRETIRTSPPLPKLYVPAGPQKVSGLNRSTQHWLGVYLQQSQELKSLSLS
jgi:hypothetical protein